MSEEAVQSPVEIDDEVVVKPRRGLWIAMIVLTLIGLGIATYLTITYASGGAPVCTTGGCEQVENSEFSTFAGISVPVLGLIGYVMILISLLVPGELARFATLCFVLIGFGFSMYLTYLELFVIDAICQWCVGSAVVLTILLPLAIWRALRTD